MEEKNKFLLLMLQSMLENSQDMVFVKDINQRYVTASQTFLKKVGCSMDEITGMTDLDIFGEQHAYKYMLEDEDILKSAETSVHRIKQVSERENRKEYISISKYLLKAEDGNIVGLYGIARDVTAEVLLEEEQKIKRHSEQLFDCVLEADLTEDKMFSPDGEGWCLKLNILNGDSYSKTLLRIADEFIHPSYKNNFITLYDVEKLRNDYDEGRTEFQYVAYTQFTKERFRWTEFRTRIYFSRFSGTLRITVFLKDVDREVKHRENLQKKSMTDALTGLSNRGYMLERITDYISQEKRKEDICALIFIDLDNFKQVNDKWGHKYGDKVLLEVAMRLKTSMWDKEICSRLGGDEFLVFLKGMSTQQEVEDRAKSLLHELEIEFSKEGKESKVTCSIGIALCNSCNIPVDLLLQNADRAMFRAKEQGKNQIYFYDEL